MVGDSFILVNRLKKVMIIVVIVIILKLFGEIRCVNMFVMISDMSMLLYLVRVV